MVRGSRWLRAPQLREEMNRFRRGVVSFHLAERVSALLGRANETASMPELQEIASAFYLIETQAASRGWRRLLPAPKPIFIYRDPSERNAT